MKCDCCGKNTKTKECNKCHKNFCKSCCYNLEINSYVCPDCSSIIFIGWE
jgi:hypothetical protein